MASSINHVPANADTTIVKQYSLAEAKEVLIRNHNLFTNGHDTEISDAEFDALHKLVCEAESEFNIYEHTVYENVDGKKVAHEIGIYRPFSKVADIHAYDTEEKFNQYKSLFTVLPKFDGSSVIAYYKNGKLKDIISRGDDCMGFVNTQKLRYAFPESLPGVKCVFAEALVSIKEGGRAQANGAINSNYTQDVVKQYLNPIIWDYLDEDGTRHPNCEVEVTSYEVFCRIRDKGEFEFNGKVYPVDGIVGYPRNGDPTLNIHKLYFLEKKESNITGIKWSVGPSGLYHPVYNFTPVRVDGKMVSQANGFNLTSLRASQTFIGARVNVINGNVTIPEIHEFIDRDTNKNAEMIESAVCPVCGQKLVPLNENDMICSNLDCGWWTQTCAFKVLSIMQIVSNNRYQAQNMMFWSTPDKVQLLKDAGITKEMVLNAITSNKQSLAVNLGVPRITPAKMNVFINSLGFTMKEGMTPEELKSAINTSTHAVLSATQWIYTDKFVEFFFNLIEKLN